MDIRLFFWYVLIPLSIPFWFGAYMARKEGKGVVNNEGDNTFFYTSMWMDD